MEGNKISGYFSHRVRLISRFFQWVGNPTESVTQGCILKMSSNHNALNFYERGVFLIFVIVRVKKIVFINSERFIASQID